MTPKALFSSKRNRQKGMSFIEVLVAMVILVTGILGAVAMQASAKKGSFDALQRSLASSLTQDILERMRGNNATNLALYAGIYDGIEPAPALRCNTPGALCNTPVQLKDNDLFEWTQALRGGDTLNAGANAGGLIDAIGCIALDPADPNFVTITISWQGRVSSQDGAAANNATSQACGIDIDSDRRRQVALQAFIF